MYDEKTVAVYDEQIETYADMVTCEKPDPLLLRFIQQIKPGGLVLDLGCGPGHASAIMQDHGLKVDPIDASAEMIKLANTTYNLNARLATFDDIQSTAKYEGVWANFSLLHVDRELFPATLTAITQSLRPEGKLHLGMKTGTGSKRDQLGRLYSYYSEEELKDHLLNLRYTIDYTKHARGKGLTGEEEPWIMIQAVQTNMT